MPETTKPTTSPGDHFRQGIWGPVPEEKIHQDVPETAYLKGHREVREAQEARREKISLVIK